MNGKVCDMKHIWIYGAGVYAKRLVAELEKPIFTFQIDGVVVSEKTEDKFGVHDIYDVNEINTPNEDTLFLIAVSSKYQEEIIKHLKELGYSNYWIYNTESIYRDLVGYRFVDRRKHMSKVCMALCGYKEFLWDDVLGRLAHFLPEDVEVCLLSSGCYSDRLFQIAEENGWSYLSTCGNSLAFIQNLALDIYDDAEWIYKMDEDMFLTEKCFEKMYDMYHHVEKHEPYQIGIVAPLIPVNGYGYIRILERLGKRDIYETRFDKVLYGGHPERMIEKNPDVAKFMWGMEEIIPQLDELNDMFSKEQCYSFCNVRFSIGFILFRRDFWLGMGKFFENGTLDMGVDERNICYHCMIRSYAIVVAEDTVVGHFSFGNQTLGMRQFYLENYEKFELIEGR